MVNIQSKKSRRQAPAGFAIQFFAPIHSQFGCSSTEILAGCRGNLQHCPGIGLSWRLGLHLQYRQEKYLIQEGAKIHPTFDGRRDGSLMGDVIDHGVTYIVLRIIHNLIERP